MLKIEFAKWFNNADSPVIFMIDDFCNRWVDLNNNGKIDAGEDWGYALDGDNSAFNFLKKEFMNKYPRLKVTFFTPVGKRVNIVEPPHCDCYSGAINETGKVKDFFRKVHQDNRYEIAYHGTTHGIPGETINEFRQEWSTFSSLKEAISKIEEGQSIFLDAIGEEPKGGKYCGYIKNEFSDASIDETGFLWWCRGWNSPQEYMPYVELLEPEYFGKNDVIDMPSNVEGYLCSFKKSNNKLKRFVQIMLKPLRQINKLVFLESKITNRQIISIQEHIAPSRADKRVQTPNIYDDKDSLHAIFNFLKKQNVWFATCSEVAGYFDAREKTTISVNSENSFSLSYKGNFRCPLLTILVELENSKNCALNVIDPNGRVFKSIAFGRDMYMVNINVINGEYKLT